MAERKYVGNYMAQKVSEIFSEKMDRGIEIEKQNIADYFSQIIVHDMLAGLSLFDKKRKGIVSCLVSQTGSKIYQSTYKDETQYTPEMPQYVYPALARMKKEMEDNNENRFALSEPEVSEDGSCVRIDIEYNLDDSL